MICIKECDLQNKKMEEAKQFSQKKEETTR